MMKNITPRIEYSNEDARRRGVLKIMNCFIAHDLVTKHNKKKGKQGRIPITYRIVFDQ
jgi:hypothetical protein